MCLSVCQSVFVLKCCKQSIRRNRQMTDPFIIVGTEASIHDCAVVMRRADVCSYEYDIVFSVFWYRETSLYWLWCSDGDNQIHKGEKKQMQCFGFERVTECILVWVMEQIQATIKAVEQSKQSIFFGPISTINLQCNSNRMCKKQESSSITWRCIKK